MDALILLYGGMLGCCDGCITTKDEFGSKDWAGFLKIC